MQIESSEYALASNPASREGKRDAKIKKNQLQME
jgi:hypothetical protein